MAETVKSGGKCWSEGVEVSCPNEKTQTRNMTPKKKAKKKDKISEALEYAEERQRKWGWGK